MYGPSHNTRTPLALLELQGPDCPAPAVGSLDSGKMELNGAWFGPNYCLFYFVFFISAVIVWKSLFLNIIRFTD